MSFKGDTIFFTRAVTPARPAPRDVPPPYSGPKTLNNVMFRHFDGKTLILHGIPLTWKVKQLRQKLGQEKSLDVEDLRFIWSGKQFQDGNFQRWLSLACICRTDKNF